MLLLVGSPVAVTGDRCGSLNETGVGRIVDVQETI